MRCEVNIIKGSRCNVIMRLQRIVLYAGVGVCDDDTCNQATWWSDVIASREYNDIVSIHIMLLTANISQLLAIATLPGTDDSGQKVPLVAMDCSDHFIVHVADSVSLHTLRIQSQGRVETYSIQLSTRMVYLVQVLKIYYYVEKLTLQV